MSAPKSILKKPSATAGPSRVSAKVDRSGKGKSRPRITGSQVKVASGSGSKLSLSQKVEGQSKKAQKAPVASDDDIAGDEEGSEEEGPKPGAKIVEEGSSGLDTDDEISKAKEDGSKKRKGQKRKRPPTSAETFGSTLTSLLTEDTASKKKGKKEETPKEETAPVASSTDKIVIERYQPKRPIKSSLQAPAGAILSLSRTELPPSKAQVSLERKARRQIKVAKEEKEDRARVRNIIEGWAEAPLGLEGTSVDKDGKAVSGQEFEKGLRKTAQRGVIKLFNAILVAARNSEAAHTSLAAKAGVREEQGKKREKDNVLGRGAAKEGVLTQESFLDLVRKG